MELHPESEGMLRVETTASASFLGARIAHSETTSWLDKQTGLPRRHESVSDKRARRYTFGPAGYTVERLSGKGHAGQPLERWDVTSRAEYAYPKAPDGSVTPVFDYYGMLLHLRRLPLHDVGDEAVVPVATTHGAVPYRIQVGEAAEREETFHDRRTGVKRTHFVRELRLRNRTRRPVEGRRGVPQDGRRDRGVDRGDLENVAADQRQDPEGPRSRADRPGRDRLKNRNPGARAPGLEDSPMFCQRGRESPRGPTYLSPEGYALRCRLAMRLYAIAIPEPLGIVASAEGRRSIALRESYTPRRASRQAGNAPRSIA